MAWWKVLTIAMLRLWVQDMLPIIITTKRNITPIKVSLEKKKKSNKLINKSLQSR